jgi:hypothetical protein
MLAEINATATTANAKAIADLIERENENQPNS